MVHVLAEKGIDELLSCEFECHAEHLLMESMKTETSQNRFHQPMKCVEATSWKGRCESHPSFETSLGGAAGRLEAENRNERVLSS